MLVLTQKKEDIMESLAIMKKIGMTVLGLLILFSPGRNIWAMESNIALKRL